MPGINWPSISRSARSDRGREFQRLGDDLAGDMTDRLGQQVARPAGDASASVRWLGGDLNAARTLLHAGQLKPAAPRPERIKKIAEGCGLRWHPSSRRPQFSATANCARPVAAPRLYADTIEIDVVAACSTDQLIDIAAESRPPFDGEKNSLPFSTRPVTSAVWPRIERNAGCQMHGIKLIDQRQFA